MIWALKFLGAGVNLRNHLLALIAFGALGADSSFAATTTYTSQGAFNAATTGLVFGDFTGGIPLPNCMGSACFGGFNPLSGYNLQGATFSTPNSGGVVNVNSAGFYGAGDLTAPYAVNSSYTGTAADILTITLPGSETAFALDFGSLFNSTTATFSLSNGFTTSVVTPSAAFATDFLGFVSNTPFNTITLSVPSQQSWVVADFEFGASAVPEPSTWAMMLLGFAGLGFVGYRRRKMGRSAIRG